MPQLPWGLERHTAYRRKEAKLEEGGTYPKWSWSLLRGSGMWHVPQPLWEQEQGRGEAVAVLTKRFKDKKSRGRGLWGSIL